KVLDAWRGAAPDYPPTGANNGTLIFWAPGLHREVTPLVRSSARAGLADAAVPPCQVILVALVLRVEIIWLCFLFHDSQSQNCLMHGDVRPRITHQRGCKTALSSGDVQDPASGEVHDCCILLQ